MVRKMREAGTERQHLGEHFDVRSFYPVPVVQGSQKSSQKIIEIISQNPEVTTSDIADVLGISRRAVAKHIATLQGSGVVRRVGPDKGGYWEVIGENSR